MVDPTLDPPATSPAGLRARHGLVRPARQAPPLKLVHLNPAFAALAGEDPPTAADVPSMMSPHEKRFLYGLARDYYRGDGVIVDAGIFLGASTRCLADGLLANPRLEIARRLARKPIVSFEKGTTNPGMLSIIARMGRDLTDALRESFVPILTEILEPVADLVDLRLGDITQTAVTLDAPVEICFLDVLKTPEISHACLGAFYPRLIPNRSIVIHQDYFMEGLPYIKVHQEFLRAHFLYLGEIGSSAIFRCISPVPPDRLARLLDGIPYAEQLELAGIAMQRSADPARRFMMAMSKLVLIHEGEGREAARAYLAMIRSDFPEQARDTLHKRLVDSRREAERLLGLAGDEALVPGSEEE